MAKCGVDMSEEAVAFREQFAKQKAGEVNYTNMVLMLGDENTSTSAKQEIRRALRIVGVLPGIPDLSFDCPKGCGERLLPDGGHHECPAKPEPGVSIERLRQPLTGILGECNMIVTAHEQGVPFHEPIIDIIGRIQKSALRIERMAKVAEGKRCCACERIGEPTTDAVCVCKCHAAEEGERE